MKRSKTSGRDQFPPLGKINYYKPDKPVLDLLPGVGAHYEWYDEVKQGFERGHAPRQLLHAVEQFA